MLCIYDACESNCALLKAILIKPWVNAALVHLTERVERNGRVRFSSLQFRARLEQLSLINQCSWETDTHMPVAQGWI